MKWIDNKIYPNPDPVFITENSKTNSAPFQKGNTNNSIFTNVDSSFYKRIIKIFTVVAIACAIIIFNISGINFEFGSKQPSYDSAPEWTKDIINEVNTKYDTKFNFKEGSASEENKQFSLIDENNLSFSVKQFGDKWEENYEIIKYMDDCSKWINEITDGKMSLTSYFALLYMGVQEDRLENSAALFSELNKISPNDPYSITIGYSEEVIPAKELIQKIISYTGILGGFYRVEHRPNLNSDN